MISYDGFNAPEDVEKIRLLKTLPENQECYRAVYIKQEAMEYLDRVAQDEKDIYSGKLCVLQDNEKLPKHFRMGEDLFIAKGLLFRTGRIYLVRTKATTDPDIAMIITSVSS